MLDESWVLPSMDDRRKLDIPKHFPDKSTVCTECVLCRLFAGLLTYPFRKRKKYLTTVHRTHRSVPSYLHALPQRMRGEKSASSGCGMGDVVEVLSRYHLYVPCCKLQL